MDWTITLSRNDFPWHEIKFGAFSAKECYEKYTSVIKDPHIFLKKVLGNKEKYKKMMQNQLALSASTSYGMAGPMSMSFFDATGASGSADALNYGDGQGASDSTLYCHCKGVVVSELFAKCDGDEKCPNGGWVHPQCSKDLQSKTKEELDDMDEYYCEDCKARIK